MTAILLPLRFSRSIPALAVCGLMSATVSAQAETLCGSPPYDVPQTVAEIVADVRRIVAGFEGLEHALTGAVNQICVTESMLEAQGYFEPESRRIVIAGGLSSGLAQSVMVHELRHAEQYAQGLCPTLALGMKDYAEAVFAMEADASVTSLVVAARQKAEGNPLMWEALTAWPMQADIADSFAATLQDTGDLSLAAHDAFDAWFAEERRIDAYYVASCSDYLDQIERDHLLPQYNALAPDYLTRLCLLPDGTDYECALPERR